MIGGTSPALTDPQSGDQAPAVIAPGVRTDLGWSWCCVRRSGTSRLTSGTQSGMGIICVHYVNIGCEAQLRSLLQHQLLDRGRFCYFDRPDVELMVISHERSCIPVLPLPSQSTVSSARVATRARALTRFGVWKGSWDYNRRLHETVYLLTHACQSDIASQ